MVGGQDGTICNRITNEDGTVLLLLLGFRRPRCCDRRLRLGDWLLGRARRRNICFNGFDIDNSLHGVDRVDSGLRDGLGSFGDGASAVSHGRHTLPVLVLATGSNTDMANWCLELDKWVSLVMLIGRTGFAVGAEIKIMAHSTLIANASYV
jgi:hypothetical protein